MAPSDTSRADGSASTLAAAMDLAGWPGEERRNPPRSDRHHLILGALAAAIRDQVEVRFADRRDLAVLDVGCGDKPYLPLVAAHAVSYRGLDPVDGPYVDDVGAADDMPYEDSTFDLVLCTQVLEHVPQPGPVISELHRVLKPGGVALASTHGVHVYHPSPEDLWRWTHAGLYELFTRTGNWTDVEVIPNRNAIGCLSALIAWYLDGELSRRGWERSRRLVLTALNSVGAFLDDRYPPTLRVPSAGSLSANYLVVATK
jgi:SAM-dependent methyltransferase